MKKLIKTNNYITYYLVKYFEDTQYSFGTYWVTREFDNSLKAFEFYESIKKKKKNIYHIRAKITDLKPKIITRILKRTIIRDRKEALEILQRQ